MATWSDVVSAQPEFAQTARALLDAHVHKTIATLRRNGWPRISGIEATFIGEDLWFGSMLGAMKARDLQRDPRFALHSGSVDPPEWSGDAKVSGRAEEITDLEQIAAVFRAMGQESAEPSHLFRAEIDEVATVRLGDPADHLIIESWREGEALKRMTR